jgi:hypothetical protein
MIRLLPIIVLAASIGLAQRAILQPTTVAQTAAESPARVDRPGLAFDTKRRKLVLFGGGFGEKMRGGIVIFGGTRQLPNRTYPKDKNELFLRDLWEWTGTAWELLSADGPANYGGLPGFAYDSTRKKLVLFGQSSDPTLKEAVAGYWEWDGKSWHSASMTGR